MTLPLGPPVPDLAPAPPLETLVVRGRDVRTRPVDPDRDAPALFAACEGDDAMWAYMGYGPFPDAAALRAWMASTLSSTDPRWFAVAAARDGTPLGMAALMNLDRTHRRVELGHIWYAAAARRSTVNTEVAYLAAEAAFGTYRARRFEWKCDALNARSRAAALRLGFTPEGVFRNHLVVKGRSRDTAWFSITDAEWPAVRARLRRWLYEVARDAGGRPVVPLGG